MIGTCSSCGNHTEVSTVPVQNGSYRIACRACESGVNAGRLLDPSRFRMLVGRLDNGSILEGERAALRWNIAEMEKTLEERRKVLDSLRKKVG